MKAHIRNYFKPETILAMQDHARAAYPNESCGVVIGDDYHRCFNYATEPTKDFQIAPQEYLKLSKLGEIRAIIHSHPDAPLYPSELDMIGQMQTNVPWGIIQTDGLRTSDPNMWGDTLPIAPLIGREFMHGIHDCYSLLRDAFRLGKDELLKQGITGWPYDSAQMPEVPRNDNWWDSDKDLYQDYLKKTGWRRIDMSEARPGDGFLIAINSKKLNHAGLLLDQNLIMHHKPGRLSAREPAGIWARSADMWLRWEGIPDEA